MPVNHGSTSRDSSSSFHGPYFYSNSSAEAFTTLSRHYVQVRLALIFLVSRSQEKETREYLMNQGQGNKFKPEAGRLD